MAVNVNKGIAVSKHMVCVLSAMKIHKLLQKCKTANAKIINSVTHFTAFMLVPSFAFMFFILDTNCTTRYSLMHCFNLWVKLEGPTSDIIIIIGAWVAIIVQSQLLKNMAVVVIVVVVLVEVVVVVVAVNDNIWAGLCCRLTFCKICLYVT